MNGTTIAERRNRRSMKRADAIRLAFSDCKLEMPRALSDDEGDDAAMLVELMAMASHRAAYRATRVIWPTLGLDHVGYQKLAIAIALRGGYPVTNDGEDSDDPRPKGEPEWLRDLALSEPDGNGLFIARHRNRPFAAEKDGKKYLVATNHAVCVAIPAPADCETETETYPELWALCDGAAHLLDPLVNPILVDALDVLVATVGEPQGPESYFTRDGYGPESVNFRAPWRFYGRMFDANAMAFGLMHMDPALPVYVSVPEDPKGLIRLSNGEWFMGIMPLDEVDFCRFPEDVEKLRAQLAKAKADEDNGLKF